MAKGRMEKNLLGVENDPPGKKLIKGRIRTFRTDVDLASSIGASNGLINSSTETLTNAQMRTLAPRDLASAQRVSIASGLGRISGNRRSMNVIACLSVATTSSAYPAWMTILSNRSEHRPVGYRNTRLVKTTPNHNMSYGRQSTLMRQSDEKNGEPLDPSVPKELLVKEDINSMTDKEAQTRYYQIVDTLAQFNRNTKETAILEKRLNEIRASGRFTPARKPEKDRDLALHYRTSYFIMADRARGFESRARINRLDAFKEIAGQKNPASFGEAFLLASLKAALVFLPGGGVVKMIQKYAALHRGVEELTAMQKNLITFGASVAKSGHSLATKKQGPSGLSEFTVRKLDSILELDATLTENLNEMDKLSFKALELAVEGELPYYMRGRLRDWIESLLGPLPMSAKGDFEKYAKRFELELWKEWARNTCKIVTEYRARLGLGEVVKGRIYVKGWGNRQRRYVRSQFKEFGVGDPASVEVARQWGLKEELKLIEIPYKRSSADYGGRIKR